MTRKTLAGLVVAIVGIIARGEDTAADKTIQFPGGVVDAAWSRAYVISPTGEVDAVDLKTGKRLWSTADVGVPLLVTADRLYMLAGAHGGEPASGEVHLIVVDLAKDGKMLSRSAAIAVPEWSSLLPEAGGSFTAAGKIEEGAVTVSWKAKSAGAPMTDFGGFRRKGRMPGVPAQAAAGSVRVDVKTGKVEKLERDDTLEVPAEALAAVGHDEATYSVVSKEGGGRVLMRTNKENQTVWEHGVR